MIGSKAWIILSLMAIPIIGVGITITGTASGDGVGINDAMVPTPTPVRMVPTFLLLSWFVKKSLIPPTVSTLCVKNMVYNLLVLGQSKSNKKMKRGFYMISVIGWGLTASGALVLVVKVLTDLG